MPNFAMSLNDLRYVDKVLVMSVNLGNAGQMYLPYVGEKSVPMERL